MFPPVKYNDPATNVVYSSTLAPISYAVSGSIRDDVVLDTDTALQVLSEVPTAALREKTVGLGIGIK